MGGDRGARPIRVFVHEFVTGGGLAGEPLPPSWAAEGRAMRRALAEDFAALEGVRVAMTLDRRLPDEPGPWDVARVDDEAEAFARLARECDLTLCVAPETGGVLRERASILGRLGRPSLGCSPEAVALCGDKGRLADHWRLAGIATPPCRRVRPGDPLPRDHAYPAVLKPIDGAGSIETFRVESAEAIEAAPFEGLLQPFVPGRAMSAAFLVGAGGAGLVGVGRQDVALDGGRFTYRGGEVPFGERGDHDAEIARAVEVMPGLRGWVGVDFILNESTGRPVFLEINPRATTSYVGWREVFGKGELARRWLEGFGVRSGRTDAATAGSRVARPPHPEAPPPPSPPEGRGVVFAADGRILQSASTP